MSAPSAGTGAIVKLAVWLRAAPPPPALVAATVTETLGPTRSPERRVHVALSRVQLVLVV